MSRFRYVWDKQLECLVEITDGSNRAEPEKRVRSPLIVRDIEPYKAAAVDKATGQRPLIGGRRQHREFLQRNGYREMGNEFVVPVREGPSKNDIVSDIKRAIGSGMSPEIRAHLERVRRSG